MENQPVLFKGELMEELIRNYFLSLGFYVARGVKYKFENFDITDIDLFLYGRSSSLTRQRINVDIKNKKSPQAFERILWTNGLMKLLKFDSCIIATSDQRPVIQTYGQLHNTTILDGAFLSKLRSNPELERLSEEELCEELSLVKNSKTNSNRDWKYIYDLSKSKLLTELDFSGFNSVLSYLLYFIEKVSTDVQKRNVATRMIYLMLSHLLIIIDFILKDIAFLEISQREKKLSDGFKFGNLGKTGVDKIVSMAAQISGNSVNSFLKSFEELPINILTAFFSKNDTSRNVFAWAKEFEQLGYKRSFIALDKIESHLRGVFSVFLDYSGVDRRKFFDNYTN